MKKASLAMTRGGSILLLPLFLTVVFAACSTETKRIFFDIPPPSQEELNRQEVENQQPAAGAASAVPDLWGTGESESLEPAPMEAVLNWEAAQDMLPKHQKGEIDWTAALEQGLIRPRTGNDPKAKDAAAFKYDFVIEAAKPKFNAYFPHSAHTQWLGCQNCHIALYPLRRNPSSMKEMRSGASCGSCHGKVAFSLKDCKLCHLNM